jgi:LacI family transcriptional regulator
MFNSQTQCGKKKRRATPARPPHIPHVLLLIDTAGAFGRGVIEGIGRYALENGPWSVQYEYRALDSLPPEWVKEWKGDGIISRTTDVQQAKMLRETKLPLVELHGDPKCGYPEIGVDCRQLWRMVFEHFQNCGLRHFGFFTYGEMRLIKDSREACCRIIEEHGYRCHIYRPPPFEQGVPVWHESQLPNFLKWVRDLPNPLGIFTTGDLHAVRLMNLCRELNIAVPEEMAIMGVGNDQLICETVRPTLSSVDLNAQRIGYEAARLLDQRMAGKKHEVSLLIPPSHIVVRQSTDLAAVEDADVARAVRFIREFACLGIDVPRVAQEVRLSRSVLEERFRRYLGRTPKAEIMRIRVEHAKMLLTKTDKISEHVARKSGFSSLVYFTKAFHREVGMTPNAYRKLHRSSVKRG